MCCGWRLEGPGALARERDGAGGGAHRPHHCKPKCGRNTNICTALQMAIKGSRDACCIVWLVTQEVALTFFSGKFPWQKNSKVERNFPTTVRCSDFCLGCSLAHISLKLWCIEPFDVRVQNLTTVCLRLRYRLCVSHNAL